MDLINVAYCVSFVIDRKKHNSAITILEPLPDGGFKAIRVIRGKEAEALYDMIMSSGEDK